jgi:hypothetical protein
MEHQRKSKTNYQVIVGARVIHIASLALAPDDLDLAFGAIDPWETTYLATTRTGSCGCHLRSADGTGKEQR